MAPVDPVAQQNLVPEPPPPPPPTQDTTFIEGDRTGREVGTFNGGTLEAGLRAQPDFGTFEEAAAYARGIDHSSAIVEEQGRYVVYKTAEQNNGAWLLSSGRQFESDRAITEQGTIAANTRPSDPSVVAMVTDDAYLIDFSTNRVELAGPVTGPFSGRIAVYGADLASITDKDAFMAQYELALRDTALFSLDQAETVANDTLGRLQGTTFTADDQRAINSTVTALQDVDRRIAAVEAELSDARGRALRADLTNPAMYLNPTLGTTWMSTPGQNAARAEIATLSAELDQLQLERIAAAQDFPLLLRVDLDSFTGSTQAQQVAMLRSETESVLEDIETTRQNVLDGDFNLWTNSALRSTVTQGLGLSPERTEWVEAKARSDARWEAVTSIGTAVLGVGLAIGGAALAPFTAGSSLTATVAGGTMIAAGVGIGVYDAVTETQKYLRDQAATNTALDPNAGLLPPEDAGHWGWVALAWVGVGIDAAEAVAAVSKLARAGTAVGDLLQTTPEATRALDDVAQQLGVSSRVLREALQGAGGDALSTRVLSPTDFARAFGSQAGEAVTLVDRAADGTVSVQVVFREGLSPGERLLALSEETVHVRQLTDPANARHADNLSEANLARWAEFGDTQKLEAYRSRLTLEIEAQQNLIRTAGDTPAGRELAERANERLGAMQRQLDEVNGALDGGRVPAWLADAAPPRLFAEPKFPLTNEAAVRAGYPELPPAAVTTTAATVTVAMSWCVSVKAARTGWIRKKFSSCAWCTTPMAAKPWWRLTTFV